MNSISLTSYTLKSENNEELYNLIRKKGFKIEEAGSQVVIKDSENDQFNYAVIFRSKIILLEDRSQKDPEFRTRSSELQAILDSF